MLIELEKRLQAAVTKKMLESGKLSMVDIAVEHLEFLSELESESYGSDSSVSDGLPMQILHASIHEVFYVFSCSKTGCVVLFVI